MQRAIVVYWFQLVGLKKSGYHQSSFFQIGNTLEVVITHSFVFVLKNLRKDDVLFDVGAHIGLFTLPSTLIVGENGNIYAFKPSNLNLRFLRKNIKLNQFENIRVIEKLVGLEEGEQDFYEDVENVNPTGSAIYVDPKNANIISCKKEIITIDKYVDVMDSIPNFIKIDVKGFELSVLEGALKHCGTIHLF